jgi:hypothetical protein
MLVYENESNEKKRILNLGFILLLLIFVICEQFRVVGGERLVCV